MSSTETLTFGPEWLRNLSGGSASAISPGSSSSIPTAKFKLAQYRYGREEMLALFEKQDEIHPELAEAPNLISKEALTPISLIPLTEDDQRAFSGGVNSESYRGRGGSGSYRGRSAPPRGRGRGRGEGYSRSMSQTDDGTGPPYSRGSSRDYTRRESWDDRGFGRGRSFDDGPGRKPLRRSDVSEDWRSDANQASGDGVDNEDSRPEWRPPAPSRRDSWRDGGRNSGVSWRDGGGREWNEVPSRRPLNRTRSLSNKFDQGDSGLMPEWAEDTDNMEVGMFNSSGAFEIRKSAPGSKNDTNNQRSGAQVPLKRIEERDKSVGEEEAAQAMLDREEMEEPISERDENSPRPNEEDVFEEVGDRGEVLQEEPMLSVEPPTETPPPIPAPVPQPAPEVSTLMPEPKVEISEAKPPQLTAAEPQPVTTQMEEEPQMHHLEEAALKLVDSISEADDHSSWGAQLPGVDPLGTVNPSIPDLATKWFYKDPQGETQGPFGAQEMKEWFIAGYFTVNLLVKRACDPQFIALGDLIAKWGGMPFDKKHGLSPQPSSSDLQLLALQQQQQKQLQLQQQQQQQILQQQQLLQHQQVIRALQQQQALMMQQLSKSEDFQALPVPQQQALVAQYMQQLQQQQAQVAAGAAPLNVASAPSSLHGVWENDPSIVRRHSPVPMATAQQQQLLELLKQKTEEQALAKKKQEEQEEQRKREEEQRRREEEQRRREQEEQRRREEEQRRKEQEELQRKREEVLRLQAEEAKRKEEEARRLQAERLREQMLQEQERIRKEEERKEELRKLEEEKERIRQEEARKREEEERKRKEALKRQAEEEKRRQEESFKRKVEEENEKQRKQKEKERLLQQKQEEERKLLEKKAQEEAARKAELQRQKEEAQRKRQQEQLKDIKLPASANWAHQPTSVHSTISVASIQKQEAAEERRKEQEQLRLMKQQQKMQGATPAKGVWGSGGVPGMSAPTPAPSNRPLSLMQIQIEEEKRQQQQKQTQPKPELSFPTALAWSGRQPQAAAPAAWGLTAPMQQPTTVGLWELAKPKERTSSDSSKHQAKTSRGKQKGGGAVTSAESSSVASLFKQSSQSDPFSVWCEEQLKRLQAVKNIDISTFVAFLREIESPYDVKDYVVSYLGETRATREFAESFIQRRNSYLKQQRQQRARKPEPEPKKVVQSQPAVTGWNQIAAERSQLEVVTGNTKKGKKKQRKLQKVDPSILGFSVNAASDRFNMGEIEVPEDT